MDRPLDADYVRRQRTRRLLGGGGLLLGFAVLVGANTDVHAHFVLANVLLERLDLQELRAPAHAGRREVAVEDGEPVGEPPVVAQTDDRLAEVGFNL